MTPVMDVYEWKIIEISGVYMFEAVCFNKVESVVISVHYEYVLWLLFVISSL